MYRVNHIMRTINEMSSYAPHMKVNRMVDRLGKLQRVSFCFSVISFLLLVIFAWVYGAFNTRSNMNLIYVSCLYFFCISISVIYLLIPILNAVSHIYDFKGEVVNELIYVIDSDEQYIEALMPYSLEELTYVVNCIHARVSRLKSKFFSVWGGNSAMIAIMFLSYSAMCYVNKINIGEVSSLDKVFVASLIFILYTSLTNMCLKQKITYLESLEMIIDMVVKIKSDFNIKSAE